MNILYIPLLYVLMGIGVYLYKIECTPYVEYFQDYIKNEIPDTQKRAAKLMFGEKGALTLIFLVDFIFVFLTWPKRAWNEIKIGYKNWKIKKLRQGMDLIREAYKDMDNKNYVEGKEKLNRGMRIIRFYTTKEK